MASGYRCPSPGGLSEHSRPPEQAPEAEGKWTRSGGPDGRTVSRATSVVRCMSVPSQPTHHRQHSPSQGGKERTARRQRHRDHPRQENGRATSRVRFTSVTRPGWTCSSICCATVSEARAREAHPGMTTATKRTGQRLDKWLWFSRVLSRGPRCAAELRKASAVTACEITKPANRFERAIS